MLVTVTVRAVLAAVIPRPEQPLRFRAAAILAAEELPPPLGVATAPNPTVKVGADPEHELEPVANGLVVDSERELLESPSVTFEPVALKT